jgi:hypothetical protein
VEALCVIGPSWPFVGRCDLEGFYGKCGKRSNASRGNKGRRRLTAKSAKDAKGQEAGSRMQKAGCKEGEDYGLPRGLALEIGVV